MKRVISLLLSVLLVANVAFARNFFTGRFLEVKADVPFGFSNDIFAIDDFLVNDLVIDLTKISQDVAKNDNQVVTAMRMNPNVSTKLRIAGISLGAKAGVDIYSKIGFSDGLFKLLGEGYKTGDTLDISLIDPVVDTFAYVEIPFGLEFEKGKWSFNVAPGAFMPLVIMQNSNTKATVLNKDNGDVSVELNNDMNFYTPALIGNMVAPMFNPKKENEGNSSNPGSTTNNDPAVNFNPSDVSKYLGFDLTANAQYKFGKNFGVRVDARIPIVPAKMDQGLNVKNTFKFNTNIMDMAQQKEGATKQEPFVNDIKLSELEEQVTINRPLKFNGYADLKLLGFLDFTAGGGLGVRRPGSTDYKVYPEYYLSAGLNLFEMLKLSASVQYTDQLFINSVDFVFNLRFVEIDAGVSFESPDFVNSLRGAGVGGYVGVAVGI